MTAKKVQTLIRKLNDKQQEIFYHIRNWCLQVVFRQHAEPFKIFLTGGAGTGKTGYMTKACGQPLTPHL
jgi:predicted ATPase